MGSHCSSHQTPASGLFSSPSISFLLVLGMHYNSIVYNAGVWYDEEKPTISTFFAPWIDSLKKLYKTIEITLVPCSVLIHVVTYVGIEI